MAPDGLGLFEGDVGVELVFQQPVKELTPFLPSRIKI